MIVYLENPRILTKKEMESRVELGQIIGYRTHVKNR